MEDNTLFNPQIGRSGSEPFRAKSVPSKQPGKNFQKVLAKEKREGRQHSDQQETVKEEPRVKGKESYESVASRLTKAEGKERQAKVSLFDLASAQEEKSTETIAEETSEGTLIPVPEFSEEVHQHSLSALFAGYGSKEKLKVFQKEVMEKHTTATTTPLPSFLPKQEPSFVAETGEKPKTDVPPAYTFHAKDESPRTDIPPLYTKPKTEEHASQFTQEFPDLASVNPIAATQQPHLAQSTTVEGTEQPQPIAPHLREIVDQLIDKLYIMSREGRSDTLITLKHPPILSGSNLVITEFDTAKGEFNLTFENLTQAAKQLLDAQENQQSLRFALEQKGFVMHILTTTTQTETQIAAAEEGAVKDQREEEDRHGQEQRKQDQEDKEG
ncbi:MAG: hypothetical protein WB791_09415 [Waddliaceae bacterium]